MPWNIKYLTSKVFLVSIAVTFGSIVEQSKLPNKKEIKHPLKYHEESHLDFTQLSGRYGFISEEHTVITEDGYILTIFRMRKRECSQIKRPPVILMHGLLFSADAWLDAGPNAGLAYLIAAECHELWVGNQRGNYYSRRHVSLDPDKDNKYWQFSVDEIGLYDIPATIDYVLKQTGEEKLNYVGFSQGAGTFFIMCSERPGYCDKANVLIALAPATRHTHSKSVLFRILAESVSDLEGVLTLAGFHELLPRDTVLQKFLALICKFEEACNILYGLVDSFHPKSITSETLQMVVAHFPAGTSTLNMARYGQSMKSDIYQKFDYGRSRNLHIYGEENPPRYNITAVTVPLVAMYGRNDYIVDIKDVFWLVEKLPNVLEAIEVADPLWNHFDVMFSQYVNQTIFSKVNEYLTKYSKK